MDTVADPFHTVEGLFATVQRYSLRLTLFAAPVFLWFGSRVFSSLRSCLSQVFSVKPPKRHNEISHLLIHGREDDPVPFDRNSLAFRLILQIREETHKTAVQYHRKRREMRDFTSDLSDIPGVGEKRKLKLLKQFGSIERIAKATAEDLSPFVGKKTAG